MCEFGDAVYKMASDTGAAVNFDYDERGLYAFVVKYGEPGCNGQWEHISSADNWREKVSAWSRWYNQA